MAAAGVLIAAAILVAAIVIFFALHRFVQGQIDQRLDTHILFLSSMLTRDQDGKLKLTGTADGPPFDRRRHGWYWQIVGPKNVLRSQSLDGATMTPPDISNRPVPPPPPPPPGVDRPPPPDKRPAPADGVGPFGEALHYRIKDVLVSGVHAQIVASAPRAAVNGPLREAMVTLAIALSVLAIALILAMFLQVRLGLRPLDRLRRSIADVRAGRRDQVPERQPREVQPLADELNALLKQNAANLERARRHVANLAHGLKTPLATLTVALPKDARNVADLHRLVELMDRRIRHHLGRARAAAVSGPVRARTELAPSVADIAAVLGKVNADKLLSFVSDIPPRLAVACEQQDVDEMIGNVLENAFRWARTQVAVQARKQGRNVILTIQDDGPGLTPVQMSQATQPGRRLDEGEPGYGFGLSITRELVELYGGSLSLDRAQLGGLEITIGLPGEA